MISTSWLFDFLVQPRVFSLTRKRPSPPPGYLPYKRDDRCPNCGVENGGTLGSGDGFQNRAIQNVFRAMKRLERLALTNSYKVLCTNVGTEDRPCMLKEHPSRYGLGKLMCCDTEIWHDFFDEDGSSLGKWAYYYKPTGQKTLGDFR